MLLATIDLGFNPLLGLGPLTLRWETLGVTVGVLIALAIAAALAPSLDQLVLIIVGIVPGAVVGGRLVHVLDYAGAYAANPVSIIDPRFGSLSLLGAVMGGTLSALYVCRLLKVSAAEWADRAAIPLLVALGVGKFAQLLGGSGQGLPFEGPWAVAFVGDGPWVSLAPSVPSHPSQVYEALWLLAGIPVVLVLGGPRRNPPRFHPYVAWADRVGSGRSLFVSALCGFWSVDFSWASPGVIPQSSAR